MGKSYKRVPQGSVLGPLLFVIFIDDLERGINGKVFKFADDTKLVSRVLHDKERNEVRNDLDKLMNWSSTWKMPFNVEKCKIMHVGNGNLNCNFVLWEKWLDVVSEVSDLGVLYTDSFKQGMQCAKASKSANKIAELIYRTISSRSVDVMLPLYKSLVRPKLEYCIQAWKPFLKKDVLLLEKVQKRFTKNIKGCKGLSYGERLNKLSLTSIENRILSADLLLTYKIVTGKGYNDLKYLFKRSDYTSTRGNKLKLQKK
jgi:ribonuclease P/MRP protein subunit RPP40